MGRKTSNKRGVEEFSRPEKRSISGRPPLPRPVEVIAEDDEEPTSTFVSPTSGRVLPIHLLPKRADASQFNTNGRTRAISTSHIQTGAPHILARKSSSPSAKATISISQKRSVRGLSPLELSDKPNRTRKIQRDITDMDSDDIMNGSDDEKSESRAPSSFNPSKISKGARDLIDFLDQGPPTNFAPPPPPPQSPAASSAKSAGRFQRMISRLTGSSSNEKLREEGAKLKKTPVTNPAFNTNPPQTPVKKGPTLVVATPPPRLQSITQQITPPNSPPTINQDSLRPVQRRTSVRKKVPPLDPELETSGVGQQRPVSRIVFSEPPRPSPLTNGNERPNWANEAHNPSPSPSSSPDLEPRIRASIDTIASNDKIVFRRPTPTPPTKIVVEVVTPAPAPSPLPITVRSPSPSQGSELPLDAAHAQSLRELMSVATTADECRVLVDMFLARIGFPIDRSTNADPYPSPISSTDPSDIDLESSVIETLLGGGSSRGPSTATQSARPSEVGQADESGEGTSDAETCNEAIDSPLQRSPSRISQDARVNPPPPPATRLLAVA